ncbi:unnamed protein product [Oppiella nova]|uniref:Acyl-coenzyme A thioesterase 13 n=1 Tax=Oppiella nova TaxID=334625 RepID=A0A7R9QX82_9ACAR|nr:unnamed protein product [Oppiella nova]CAG2178956.1 unnamed protein product [Oppiella nova]
MSQLLTTLMRNTLKTLVESNGFDRVLQQVNITSASKGRISAEMVVTEGSTNFSGRLHGGMTATIVDQLSSLALTAALVTDSEQREQHFAKVNSVSLDLSVQFLSGVQLGDTLLIEANALKCGKNIAFLSVDIYNKKSNQLVANGKHTKYLLNK